MEKKLFKSSLSGIPQTMLLTFYNRICEARRPDGILYDPEALRIYEMLDFDFVSIFGETPRGGMAARAVFFDRILTEWLRDNPDGFVVSLGEGLETQRHRVDNGKVRWLSIDLPEATALREKLLKSTDRFKNLSGSAFDFSWMSQVDPSQGVFIVAQGLFMYFEEDEVCKLVTEVFKRFPNVHLLFDFVSKSFVQKTQKGFQVTPRYTLPAMAWGLKYDEVEQLLRTWLPEAISIRVEHYDIFIRGLSHFITDRLLRSISFFGNQLPGIVHVSATAVI